MQTRLKTYRGAIVVLSGLPAWAETSAQVGAASTAASAPEDHSTKIPDPGWFIAGFVAGVVVGYVAGKALGGSKASD